jgi:hypothetical protein
MSKFTSEQLHQIVETLQGTTSTLNDGIEEVLGEDYSEDDLTQSDHEFINNEIFRCDTCGWWCEICENSETDNADEMICQDCVDE